MASAELDSTTQPVFDQLLDVESHHKQDGTTVSQVDFSTRAAQSPDSNQECAACSRAACSVQLLGRGMVKRTGFEAGVWKWMSTPLTDTVIPTTAPSTDCTVPDEFRGALLKGSKLENTNENPTAAPVDSAVELNEAGGK